MTEKFNVHICVTSSAKLATIMSVLDGEAKLISVEQVEEKTKRKTIVRHKVNGVDGAGIVMDLAKGGHELTVEKASAAFVNKGFSPKSAAPRLSELVKSGQLALIRKGVYKINPKAAK